MFKVERPLVAPECTQKTGYNTREIVAELEKIFHGKCYLCEQNSLSDPEIEHFLPHEGKNLQRKYNWNNLYYSCSRCNSLKGSTHTNLLDCCDPATDVFSPIMLLLPSRYDDDVIVEIVQADPSEQITNTAALLKKCYNDNSTGLRGITREVLIEKIHNEWHKLINYRNTITSVASSDEEVNLARGRIKSMLKNTYPFSVFWKWWVLGDGKLLKAMPEISALLK